MILSTMHVSGITNCKITLINVSHVESSETKDHHTIKTVQPSYTNITSKFNIIWENIMCQIIMD